MLFFDVERLAVSMNLTPYQHFILRNNYQKYDLRNLMKRDELLLAPYRGDICPTMRERFARLIYGRKVDLIGTDKILVQSGRGVKIYPAGFFKAYHNGGVFYADKEGNRVERVR